MKRLMIFLLGSLLLQSFAAEAGAAATEFGFIRKFSPFGGAPLFGIGYNHTNKHPYVIAGDGRTVREISHFGDFLSEFTIAGGQGNEVGLDWSAGVKTIGGATIQASQGIIINGSGTENVRGFDASGATIAGSAVNFSSSTTRLGGAYDNGLNGVDTQGRLPGESGYLSQPGIWTVDYSGGDRVRLMDPSSGAELFSFSSRGVQSGPGSIYISPETGLPVPGLTGGNGENGRGFFGTWWGAMDVQSATGNLYIVGTEGGSDFIRVFDRSGTWLHDIDLKAILANNPAFLGGPDAIGGVTGLAIEDNNSNDNGGTLDLEIWLSTLTGEVFHFGLRPGAPVVVPEPSSLALLALGLCGILGYRRRQNKRIA